MVRDVRPVSSTGPKNISPRRLEALVEMARSGTPNEKANAVRKLTELGYDLDGNPIQKIAPSITAAAEEAAPKATRATVGAAPSSAAVKSTSEIAKDAIDKTKSSSTTRKVAESLDAAKNAVKGKANARNLLLAGAASIVGVGLYKRNRETRIEPDEQYY